MWRINPSPQDYNLAVLTNRVPGHRMISIIGHTTALTTTRTTVYPGGSMLNIDQSGLHASPSTVCIASESINDTAAGTGARSALLTGLDSAGKLQTETVSMNGQTETASVKTYSAVNGFSSGSWGSSTLNEGIMHIGNGPFTGGIPSVKYFSMDAETNKAHTAYFSVPSEKKLFIRQLILNVATTNKDVSFFVERSENGINWFTEFPLGMEPGEFQARIMDVRGFEESTHIRMEAKSSASGTDVTVAITGELMPT